MFVRHSDFIVWTHECPLLRWYVSYAPHPLMSPIFHSGPELYAACARFDFHSSPRGTYGGANGGAHGMRRYKGEPTGRVNG
jgi:hypothetical protein